MRKMMLAAVGAIALMAAPVQAGQYHTGNTLLCSDCHTPHFSMQHNWQGGSVSTTIGTSGGNWLGTTGPNEFLLKAPANDLCLSCHNGTTFAPDVLGANTNAAPSKGRSAGALNVLGGAEAGYEDWKGHTLGSTATPPGYDPTVVGLSATQYDPTAGLECIDCHIQHGSATVYRNLGPRSFAGAPTYVISASNDTTKDVWIQNVPSTYLGGSGDPATFNPYYDFANISFNRIDKTVGTNKTSNGLDSFCAVCHGQFHGGPGDANIGASAAKLDGFIRHPTSQTTIGGAAAQSYGGHSALSRYVNATTKTRVYASDRTAYTDASPGCLSCHKAHGNQNPFGLFFLNRNATAVNEEGGYAASQTTQDLATGYRNLCGQCHGQGN